MGYSFQCVLWYRSATPCCQRVAFIKERLAGFDDVLQEDPTILWLLDVPVEGVEALAVLCAHQCAVDVHELDAELAADLILYRLGCAFVVLIEE